MELLIAALIACALAAAVVWTLLRVAYRDDAGQGAGGAGTPRAQELLSLSWEEFEALLREAFERDGFRVFERSNGTTGVAAGLADIVLERGGKRWFVSAKYWRERTVAGQAVQELYGAMVAGGASGGFIVTHGAYGPAAKVLARERRVELIDGERLASMIEPVREAPSDTTRRRLERARQAETTGRRQVPCPLCGRPMQRRLDRSGPRAGQSYFSCSDFPRCRGTREIG
jgi:restriction system protein